MSKSNIFKNCVSCDVKKKLNEVLGIPIVVAYLLLQ